MISGQCFYRRFFKNWQKIAQNYPLFHENRVSIQILINLVLVHPKNIHRKFEPNLCSSLREEVEVKMFTTAMIMTCEVQLIKRATLKVQTFVCHIIFHHVSVYLSVSNLIIPRAPNINSIRFA